MRQVEREPVRDFYTELSTSFKLDCCFIGKLCSIAHMQISHRFLSSAGLLKHADCYLLQGCTYLYANSGRIIPTELRNESESTQPAGPHALCHLSRNSCN